MTEVQAREKKHTFLPTPSSLGVQPVCWHTQFQTICENHTFLTTPIVATAIWGFLPVSLAPPVSQMEGHMPSFPPVPPGSPSRRGTGLPQLKGTKTLQSSLRHSWELSPSLRLVPCKDLGHWPDGHPRTLQHKQRDGWAESARRHRDAGHLQSLNSPRGEGNPASPVLLSSGFLTCDAW